MTLNEYQKASRDTTAYPDAGESPIYPALGLAGEAGEACEVIKKVWRDKGGVWDEESRAKLTKELGDVMWYVAAVATECGIQLDVVAEVNLAKLRDRLARGVIKGEGNNR